MQRANSAALGRWVKWLELQTPSASRLGSANVGPAGRRRPALFGGELARSLARRPGVHHRLIAVRLDAADLVPRVVVRRWVSAA